TLPGDQTFALTADDGTSVPVQSWPLAYWPDGSLKWSAHALAAQGAPAASYTLTAGEPAAPETAVRVTERAGHVDVDTGVVTVRIPTRGTDLVAHVRRTDTGVHVATHGRLVNVVQRELPD